VNKKKTKSVQSAEHQTIKHVYAGFLCRSLCIEVGTLLCFVTVCIDFNAVYCYFDSTSGHMLMWFDCENAAHVSTCFDTSINNINQALHNYPVENWSITKVLYLTARTRSVLWGWQSVWLHNPLSHLI